MTEKLASKASLCDRVQQKGSRGSTRGRGEAVLEAASTRRSELDRREISLRARFEDVQRQERQPNKAESALIHADLARIRARRVEENR